MKKTWGFIVFVAAVVLFLYLISGKRAVYVPGDAVHAGITADAVCRTCHAPGMKSPLKDTHPPKDQCLTCHKFKKVWKAEKAK
ncbi:MAG: hypothetical protein A2X56_12315 [Nitrospirae bacterium GWC2_57_13]|jgi:hypothetical protein|nr:MAG: hypothetical protein A2X56_12315 [Nitrospirae bacterium GWC2_57_13]OGW46209.1 MAG: hypothetical protein A2X57_05520 [Nitrospirae bacterium GWD2_57_8]